MSLSKILAALNPVLNPGVYVYCSVMPDEQLSVDLRAAGVLAAFRESEGLTVIAEERHALAAGWRIRFRAAWITLGVNSELEGVGLTAAVATALAKAHIACNVVAAVHHDHLFVPLERAEESLQILHTLAREAAAH